MNGKLYIEASWQQEIAVDSYILVECYRILDPADSPKVWSDPWLKHYATALIKRQWAVNMKKFQGLQLPGGVSIDGDALYKEAQDEIKELEDELMNKAAPLQWFIG
jgi:hypothetical protein